MPTHETVAQHTPGPWQIEYVAPNGGGLSVPFVGLPGKTIAVLMTVDEHVANAHVIAAAPDMLEALRVARRVLEVACGTTAPYIREALKLIDPAIAKATGAVLLLLLLASSAFAQERPSLAGPLAVYAAGAALDVHSTYRALHYKGVKELNPLAAWADARPATFVVVAVAEDVAIVWALHRWIAPTRPTLFRVGLYAVGALRVGIAARNYHVDPSRERVR